MIAKSEQKSVDEGHERPSHACGSGPTLPGFCACRLPMLRDCAGHLERHTASATLWTKSEQEELVFEAA